MVGLSTHSRAASRASDMALKSSSPFPTLQYSTSVLHDLYERRYDEREDLPVVGGESLGDVFGKGDIGGSVDGDFVVVVDADELAELEMSVAWA